MEGVPGRPLTSLISSQIVNSLVVSCTTRRYGVTAEKGRHMRVKSLLAASVCVIAIAGASAGAAFAGEIKGPGSPTGIPAEGPDTAALAHANSICSASGLNEYHAGVPGELLIRTQSYGQLVAAGLKEEFPSPGVACNGHTGFFAGG
jgi:hypothetical protein